jgi:hypothetical protein
MRVGVDAYVYNRYQRIQVAKEMEIVTRILPDDLQTSASLLFRIEVVQELSTEESEYSWNDPDGAPDALNRAIQFVWRNGIETTWQFITKSKATSPAPTAWENENFLKMIQVPKLLLKWVRCETSVERTDMILAIMACYRGYWRLLGTDPREADLYPNLTAEEKDMAKKGWQSWLFKP